MPLNIDWNALGIELTDEQKAEFDKMSDVELDRARTQASATAHKNAEKEFNMTLEEQANERAQQLLDKLTQTEDEKIEAARKQLEADQKAFAAEKKTTAVSAKLKAAGYTDDVIADMAPLFTTKDTVSDCETVVDSFLALANAQITAKVDAAKEQLASAGAEPGGSDHGAAVTKLNEQAVCDSVYKHVTDDGFMNTRQANLALDVEAIQRLSQTGE